MKAGRDTPRAVRDFDHREKMERKIRARRYGLAGHPAVASEHLINRLNRAGQRTAHAKKRAEL